MFSTNDGEQAFSKQPLRRETSETIGTTSKQPLDPFA
jgi:hypothetical protein